MVRSEGETERIVESSALRNGNANTSREYPKERVGDGGDPIIEAVSNIEVSCFFIKGDARWADDQRVGVGALGESGGDDGAVEQLRRSATERT